MLLKGEGIEAGTRGCIPELGPPATDPQAYGAESNPTGDPIGGDPGYRRIVTRGDYTVDAVD